MPNSRETEIYDRNKKPVSYYEMQDWLAEPQQNDLTDKMADLVNKNGRKEGINLDRLHSNPDERRKPGVELLARYLHHLCRQGKLYLFEKVYQGYYPVPDVKKDETPPVPTVSADTPDIPQAGKIVADFDSCYSSPQTDIIISLESSLAQLHRACDVYSFTVPVILIELETVLGKLKKNTRVYKEAEKKMEDALKAPLEVTGLKKELKEKRTAMENSLAELRDINGTQFKHKLQTLIDSLEKAEKKADAEARRTAEEERTKSAEKAQKAAEKQIPAPKNVDGASVVYLCIKSAEDFADFLVHSQSVDFDGLPHNSSRVERILAFEGRRQAADDILSEFPFLNGLTVASNFETIRDHMNGAPGVLTEDIVKLIEYLKFEATSARGSGKWRGVGKQDLTTLENFVRNLEQIVIERLTHALDQLPAGLEPHQWAALIANKQFFDHVDETHHHPEETKQHLKSLPKRGNTNKPAVIRETIKSFIKDIYAAVGKPKETDGSVVKTLKDALRVLAGERDEPR
ncbi:MAG: hypothetical protein AAB739_00160 [Patescibacteria group bacterium]